ncbi:MAG: hypothetical protein LBR49_06675 [Tannerella sp.]|jgi:hypothetical protein|nr:hypothetical protein [Tannerella sp.]
MNKKVLMILALALSGISAFSQDIISTKDRKKIEAIVVKITDDAVWYRKYEAPLGRAYSIRKENIMRIKYEDGTIDSFDLDVEYNRPVRSTRPQTSRQSEREDYGHSSLSQRSNVQNDYGNSFKQYHYFPNMGYKGFVDLGYSVQSGDNGVNRLEVSTSHGFFLNPYCFLGGGVGVHYFHYVDNLDDGIFEIPVFTHFRCHFIDSKASPFADVKLGYSVYDDTGVYFAPSVGLRIATGNSGGFFFSLGLSRQYINSYYNSTFHSDAISFKCGWDF